MNNVFASQNGIASLSHIVLIVDEEAVFLANIVFLILVEGSELMLITWFKMLYWRAKNYLEIQLIMNTEGYQLMYLLLILYLTMGEGVKLRPIDNGIFSLSGAVLVFCIYRIIDEWGLPAEECGTRVSGVYQYLVRLRLKNLGRIYLMCRMENILKHWLISVGVMFLLSKNFTWLTVGSIYTLVLFLLIGLDGILFGLAINALSDVQKRSEYLKHTRIFLGAAFLLSVLRLVGAANINMYSVIILKASILLVAAVLVRNMGRYFAIGISTKLKPAHLLHDALLTNSIKKMNKLFNKVYGLTRRVTDKSNFAFIFSKEISQLILEKKATAVSSVMPIFFLLSSLDASPDANLQVIVFSLMYVLSGSFFTLLNGLCFFARDLDNMWLLKLHKIKLNAFYMGKLGANLLFAGLVNGAFFILHEGIRIFYLHSPVVLSYLYLYAVFLVVPIGTLWGIILGSYLVPSVCVDGGQIYYDNNERGVGFFYMIFNENVISFPIWILMFAKGNPFILCACIAIAYILTLFVGARYATKYRLNKVL